MLRLETRNTNAKPQQTNSLVSFVYESGDYEDVHSFIFGFGAFSYWNDHFVPSRRCSGDVDSLIRNATLR